MGTISGVAMVLLATVLIQPTAWAQSASATNPSSHRPVQIGGGWDVFGVATGDEGGAFTIPSLRVTVPFGRRFAVEGLFGIRHENEDYDGFYGAQIKQRIVRGSDARTEVFATYGALGWYSYAPGLTSTYTGYGGAIRTDHLPSRVEIEPPAIALVGGGVERRIAPRLAIRLDVQGFIYFLYPVAGARVAGSVSIPIGHITQ